MSRIVLLMTVAVLLSACVPVANISPLPTPIGATLQPATVAVASQQEKGRVVGQLASRPSAWQGKQLTAFAAPFKPTTEGNGFFILEPSIHPTAVVNPNGSFQLEAPIDAYVIVIGPTPEEALAVQEAGHSRVVQVKANQTLDLGKVDLR